MNEPLAQTVTAEEAAFLRELIAQNLGPRSGDGRMTYANDDGHSRLWRPVEAVEATGKARCRLCSQTIPKGERCIRFGFDPYGEGSWGKLSAAYLHLTPCPEGGVSP
jgi:hypothetical protein